MILWGPKYNQPPTETLFTPSPRLYNIQHPSHQNNNNQYILSLPLSKYIFMAYRISKNQQETFSESEKLSLSGGRDDQLGSTNAAVTSHLYIKASSSAQTQASSGTLDKDVVLRRIRQHKCLKKVQNTFQSLLPQASSHQVGWLEQDDVFSSP